MNWFAVALAVSAATATGLASAPILRRLPEPAEADADGKTPYARLATPGFVLATALASLLSCLVATATTPPGEWITWLGLATVGALAIAVDASTTWMPRLLTLPLAVTTVIGILAQAALGGGPASLVRAGVGAAVVGGFFYLFYLPARGIGFADVRLMTLIGAATAAHSPSLTLWAVFAGTLLGAVWGIVHRVARGAGHFAYGPALWAGPFVALAIAALRG